MFRHGADWMVISDDRILDIILVEGTASPTELARQDHIFVGRSHINKRLIKLSDNELLEQRGNGIYALTREGIGYIYGCYDVQDESWIGLSDARASYMPNQQADSSWSHAPDYADMYRSRVDDAERQARK